MSILYTPSTRSFLISGHVTSHSPKLPLQAQTVLLPNDDVLPTTSIFTESSEIFPAEWYFFTKLGPQVSPFPVPFFVLATTKVFEGAMVVETALEKVDDFLVGDIDYCGALVE
jgi:hypothetical protein